MVFSGGTPRRASLAPSSNMTPFVFSGVAHSSLASPPFVVSPGTAASMSLTSYFFSLSFCCSTCTNPLSEGSLYPAASESPSTTIGVCDAPASPMLKQKIKITKYLYIFFLIFLFYLIYHFIPIILFIL